MLNSRNGILANLADGGIFTGGKNLNSTKVLNMPQVSNAANSDVVKIKNNGWEAIPRLGDSKLKKVSADTFDACRMEVLKYGSLSDYVFTEKLAQTVNPSN